MTEEILSFVQDRWFVIVLAIVALVIIIKVVKKAIKWLIVIAIIAIVWIYGAAYVESLNIV